jgi:hypothetical protein
LLEGAFKRGKRLESRCGCRDAALRGYNVPRLKRIVSIHEAEYNASSDTGARCVGKTELKEFVPMEALNGKE